jgi:rubrerythrin
MEEEARRFYEKLATEAIAPELKNLFTILAESEQEHHDALVKMQEKIDSLDVQFKELQLTKCIFKPLLENNGLIKELAGESDAYLNILKEEEKGIRFYEDLAAQSKDENTRKVLHMIADEERKHLSIVKNIYFFVESPKNFLASAEFSNLKEL